MIVHGRVQGVFFRGCAEDRARAEAVTGWVRNRRDGTVEAVFEGPPECVEAMIDWCRSGPRHARVQRVEVFAEEPEGLDRFEVRH